MFTRLLGSSSFGSSLSFSKILFGLSRSLQIAKTIVPVCQQVSPLMKKLPVVMNRLSNIKANLNNPSIKNTFYTQNNNVFTNNSSNNGPQFFQ